MTSSDKNKRNILHKYHAIFLEVGLILALLIFITAMKADLPREQETVDFTSEQPVVTIKDIPRTKSTTKPVPPAQPYVAAQKPNEQTIQDIPDLEGIDDLPSTDVGKLQMPPKPNNDAQENIYVRVEQNPAIIGGEKALYDELHYPKRCRKATIDGRVTLQFIVNKDGSVQDVKVVRGIGGGCDEAAVNALKKVQFKPGRQRGKPVRVHFSWSVVFQLK